MVYKLLEQRTITNCIRFREMILLAIFVRDPAHQVPVCMLFISFSQNYILTETCRRESLCAVFNHYYS